MQGRGEAFAVTGQRYCTFGHVQCSVFSGGVYVSEGQDAMQGCGDGTKWPGDRPCIGCVHLQKWN